MVLTRSFNSSAMIASTSSTVTMPSSTPFGDSTGMRRTPCCRMRCSASATECVVVTETGFASITSPTLTVRASRSRATTDNTMSRSVRMPVTLRPSTPSSTTTSDPTFSSHIRRAASATLISLRATTTTGLQIWPICMLSSSKVLLQGGAADAARQRKSLTARAAMSKAPYQIACLELQPAALEECGRDQAEQEGHADIPDRQRGRGDGDDTLTLVAAEIAGAERQLRTGEKEDRAEHRHGEEPQQHVDRGAEEQREHQ